MTAGSAAPVATVRPAAPADAQYLVEAVRALIGELRGIPASDVALVGAPAAARALVSGATPGAALLAVLVDGSPAGIVTASYQEAIRTGGRYAVIQELWVMPDSRGTGVGRALVEALCLRAARDGCAVIEVGLPGPLSSVFDGTRAAYLALGFSEGGPRMRRVLPAGERPGVKAGDQ